MSTVTRSTTIYAPLATITTYISDLRNIPVFIPSVQLISPVQTAPNGGLLGSAATFSMSILGNTELLRLTVDRYQPGPPTYVRLGNDADGTYIELRVDEEAVNQCKMQVALSGKLPGFMLNMAFGGTLETGLTNIKQAVER